MGMGHLFRLMTFARYLEAKKNEFVFIVNDDKHSLQLLERCGYKYHIVDYDKCGEWEKQLVQKYGVHYWFNDRLNTSDAHGKAVKNTQIKLITFDDNGEGANYADFQIMALPMSDSIVSRARRVLRGIRYLILNEEIDLYKRLRKRVNKICVSMGGTDTYGVTVKVVKILKEHNTPATIIVGPGFMYEHELSGIIDSQYPVVRHPLSLVRMFSEYDIAITGGGITPFEAVASGLPCIIITSENHEVPNGEYLEKIGTSYYAGHRNEIRNDVITRAVSQKNNIELLSRSGMAQISGEGCENVFNEIRERR